MTNSHTTRVMLVVFLGLLGVAYVLNQAQQRATPLLTFPTAPPEVFPGLLPTEISRIEMENVKTRRKITMVKLTGDWQATDENGKTIPVDYRQVARILQKLPNLRYSRIMEGTDLAAFGLSDGGLFIVRFDAGIGTSHSLHVGDVTSDQRFAYIQRENESKVLQAPIDDVFTLIALVAPKS